MTLNQIVSRLQALALSHSQIKFVYYNNMVEFMKNGEVIYPALFIEHPKTKISTTEHQTKHSFTIWICDLLNTAGGAMGNQNEVESDITSIAEDYIAMISSYLFQDTWTVSTEFNVQFYAEQFTDYVGAVAFDVEISSDFLNDRCQIPTNSPGLFIES